MKFSLSGKVEKKSLVISLVIFVLLSLGVWFLTNFQRERMEHLHQKTTLDLLSSRYQAIQRSYAHLTEVIYNEIIMQEDVLALLRQVAHSDENGRAILRKKLQNLLAPSYKRLYSANIKLLHFHLPDGSSFLRMHRPSRFGDKLFPTRYSILQANKQRQLISGYEEGPIFNGFRYVFPIEEGDTFLGTVELSLPFSTIRDLLQQASGCGHYFLLSSKAVINKKVFVEEMKNYQTSELSPQWLYHRADIDITPCSNFSDSEGVCFELVHQLNKRYRQEISHSLEEHDSFAFSMNTDNKHIHSFFLPVNNVKGEHVAWLVYYVQNHFSDVYLHTSRRVFAIVTFLLFLILVAYNIIIYKRKISQDQLESLVKDRTVELRKLSRVVEQSSSTIIITDLDGSIEFVNPAFTHTTGYMQEEALGQNAKILNSGYHDTSFFKEMWDTLTADQVWKGEICNKRKDGSLYWESASISPVKNETGQATHYVGVMDDITARKQADQALEESREQLALTLEGANLGSWDWRPQTNELYSNDIFLTMLGYAADDDSFSQTLERWSSLVHPDDIEPTLAILQSFLDGDDGYYRSEHRLRTADGQWKWILDVGRVISRNSEGKAERFVGVHIDITQRKQMELLLRKSKEKYQRLVNDLGDKFIVFSHRGISGEILYTSDGVGPIFGLSREDVMDKPWGAEVNWLPESMEVAQSHVIRQAEGKADFLQFDMHFLHPDGNKHTIHVSSHPVRDENGNLLSIDGILEDVSDQRRLGQQLLEAQQQAEEANKQKSQFLANMSHEIRTPMNALIGLSELVMETVLTDQQYDYLSKMHTSTRILLTIVNDILDYSQIDAGRIILEKQTFSLAKIIHDVESLFIEQATQKELELQSFVDSTIPPVLHGDASRLRQVLINLVGNALKFTSQGGVTITVSLLSRTEKQVHLKFTVVDSGIGIAADQVLEIFKPFSQVDASHTRKYGGTGLGLAISREFVEMMGGELTVQSEAGHGSEFSFTLDFDKADKEDLISNKLHDRPEGYTSLLMQELSGVTILLVEDEKINRQVATEILAKANIHVRIAGNGKEAVAAYKLSLSEDTPFSAILMDIQMPILDGYKATAQIREWEANQPESTVHIPIIAMTAHVMAADHEKSIAAGMDGYLSKPVNRNELFETLARVIVKKGTWQKSEASALTESSAVAKFPAETVLPASLPGIDVQEGIDQLTGNTELYLRLLKDFVDRFHNSSIDVEALLKQKKNDSAMRLIHTVKGVASNLCTPKLQDVATQLETALIEGHSIQDILIRYTLAWQELRESMKSLENRSSPPPRKDLPIVFADKAILLGLLANFQKQLDQKDFQAVASWQELKPYLQHDTEATKIAEIDHCITNFDFKKTRKLIKCFDEENLEKPTELPTDQV